MLLVLLGLSASPAEATLRVSSGAGGLVVRDLNNLADNVSVSAETQGGQPVFLVQNKNPLDLVKFSRQPGCQAGATDDKSVCVRGNGKITMNMAGRAIDGDKVDIGASGATSSEVLFGAGFITFIGSSGSDTITTDTGLDNSIDTGAGNDVINIGSAGDRVDAGSGNDVIRHAGDPNLLPDLIQGGSGNDTIDLTAAGADTGRSNDPNVVSGGSGSDDIVTTSGPDRVDPGPGADEVRTRAGDDEITSKERSGFPASADEVNCGSASDRVVADLTDDVDAISDPGGGTCEDVDTSPVGETPHVIIAAGTLRVSRDGKVTVRLRCPRGTGGLGCKGRLQLRLARDRPGGVQASRSRKVRYSIRAGRRKRVTLKLSDSDVRRVRSRQRAGRRTRGILVSIERGRKGRKTTVRNPQLRLR